MNNHEYNIDETFEKFKRVLNHEKFRLEHLNQEYNKELAQLCEIQKT